MDTLVSETKSSESKGIQINDVSLEKGGRNIIDSVSLDLTANRIGIVGENGSGKSTLARLICGIIEPDSGVILVEGIDVANDRANAISTVGFIFQNPDHQIIFPTVGEEIAFGLEQLGDSAAVAREKTVKLLEQVNRSQWLETSIHSLSQGQRHLVCLLSVLAMKPKVLILDEPYASLDIPTSRKIHRWLDQLEQKVVMITHDTEVLREYESVIWLDRGSVKMVGGGSEVIDRYLHDMNEKGNVDAFADISI